MFVRSRNVEFVILLTCGLLPDLSGAVDNAGPVSTGVHDVSLTVTPRPRDSAEKMTSREQGDTTIIYWPTATAQGGVELVVDNCLVFGQQCGQPAANAVCKRLTPSRPAATSFKTGKPRYMATVVLGSGMKYCEGAQCLGFSEVRCTKYHVLGKGMSMPQQTAPAPNRADAQVQDQSPAPTPATVPDQSQARVRPSAADPRTCKPGFVWRVANPSDLVCVSPESRQRAADENASAASKVDPGGAYGPDTCVTGYVWREAFGGDKVCVTPEVRSMVRDENRLAATRRVGN